LHYRISLSYGIKGNKAERMHDLRKIKFRRTIMMEELVYGITWWIDTGHYKNKGPDPT